jgi:aerotaxis receptor
VDEEVPYPDGRLIVSRTDLDGIITHANRSFIEMSGYSEEELIGAPHSILRHPDMPKAAFQDLWDTVQSGKIWQGYVKNLRKDGCYYWVKATVIPNVRAERS